MSEQGSAANVEKCGVWIKVAGYETICALPPGHDGPCLPSRSDLMNEADRLEEDLHAIWKYVADKDESGAWLGDWPS